MTEQADQTNRERPLNGANEKALFVGGPAHGIIRYLRTSFVCFAETNGEEKTQVYYQPRQILITSGRFTVYIADTELVRRLSEFRLFSLVLDALVKALELPIVERPGIEFGTAMNYARRVAKTERTAARQALRELRAASFGPVPLNDCHTLFGNYPMTSTGIRVDNYSANCNVVFRRGVRSSPRPWPRSSPLEAAGDAAAPGRRLLGRVELRPLDDQANNYITRLQFLGAVYSWAEGWGNGYAWILRRNDLIRSGSIRCIRPASSPAWSAGERRRPKPWELIYQVDGGRETFLPYEILHLKGNPGFDGVSGYNIVQLHENVLAIAQAQGEFTGEFFNNGAMAGGLVELPGAPGPDVCRSTRPIFRTRYCRPRQPPHAGAGRLAASSSRGHDRPQGCRAAGRPQVLDLRDRPACWACRRPCWAIFRTARSATRSSSRWPSTCSPSTRHAKCGRQELNLKLTPKAGKGRSQAVWSYDKALKAFDAADTETRQKYLHTAVGGPWMSIGGGPRRGRPAAKGQRHDLPAAQHERRPGQGAGSGKPAGAAGDQAKTEGQDGKPTTEDLQTGVTEPTTRANPPAPSSPLDRGPRRRGAFDQPRFRRCRRPHGGQGGRGDRRLHQAPPRRASPDLREAGRRLLRPARRAHGRGLRARPDGPAVAGRRRRGREARDSGGGDFQLSDDSAAAAYAKTLGQAHVAAQKAVLTQIMTGTHDARSSNVADGQAAAEAIEARLKALPKALARRMPHEIRQASNYFAAAAYRAAGCQQLRWMAHPADPAECRALDGQTTPIDAPFASDPARRHPPLMDDCRCGLAGVFGE